MECTPLCIRMSPATVQLLPFSRQEGQQVALLCVLTDPSGISGRCPVPEMAGGVQECLFWTGQHRSLDLWIHPLAELMSTAEEPDHPTMGCAVCCSGPGGAAASSWEDLQSPSKQHRALRGVTWQPRLPLPEEIHLPVLLQGLLESCKWNRQCMNYVNTPLTSDADPWSLSGPLIFK